MDPNQERLNEIYRLERENNKMLRSLKRRAFWGTVFRIFLILLALGVPIWLYFTYLSPIVSQFSEFSNNVLGVQTNFASTTDSWAQKFDQFADWFASSTGNR